jgi:hypothetical protein
MPRPKWRVELSQVLISNEKKFIPMSTSSTLHLIVTLQRNSPINKAVLQKTGCGEKKLFRPSSTTNMLCMKRIKHHRIKSHVKKNSNNTKKWHKVLITYKVKHKQTARKKKEKK